MVVGCEGGGGCNEAEDGRDGGVWRWFEVDDEGNEPDELDETGEG